VASGPVTSSFVPTAADWRLETVNLSSLVNQPNVRIKFEFVSDGGNNIYIDDINIAGPVGIETVQTGVNQFAVYPNPAQDNAAIGFQLNATQQVDILLLDMTGRQVMKIYSGSLAAGDHQLPVTLAGLSAGIYFVRLSAGEENSLTRKLVVE
ncbi:MAG TPA: T9SS type A sorting domain-containing protein, partial [Bacteroidia bacterium]|nr:T9SS type A sorting domain-containing protein [Bacteroidia bacterium]